MSARFILVFLIIAELPGCREAKVAEVPVQSETSIGDVALSDTMHDSLTVQQLKEIERIHRVFSEVTSRTLVETINKFKSDKNRHREIEVWSKLADTYERFALSKHIEEHDKKEEAYHLIVLRSKMAEEDAIDKAKLHHLTEDEVKEIFSYYNALQEPEKVLNK